MLLILLAFLALQVVVSCGSYDVHQTWLNSVEDVLLNDWRAMAFRTSRCDFGHT